MPFLGNQPAAQFTTIPTVQRFNGGSAAKEFTLARHVASSQSIMVSVDGVIQDTSAYSVPDGVTLTFSDTPSTGTGNIFVNYLGLILGTVAPAEGSITTNLLANDAVTSSKIDSTSTGMSLADLTVAGTSTLSTINSSGDITATNSSGNRTVGIISGASNSSVLNMGDTNAANVGQVKYHHGVNSMVLRTNSADKITLDSTGNMLFNVANTGVYLGVTAAADSNLLHDYEQGSWTATLTGSTSNPSTAVTNAGTYTKIGNMCYAQFQMSNVNSTGAAGGVRVTGLPFTSSGAQATGNVMTYVRFTLNAGSTNISPYVSGTSISFYQSTSNGGWSEIVHNAGTGAYLSVSVFYKTT